MGPEHRPGMEIVVAITVIEGEHGKGPLLPALLHHFHRLVERCQAITRPLHMTDHGIEELRCDLEPGIGPKPALRSIGGQHMMQHEDGAEAAQCRREEPGSTAHPDGVEAGTIEDASPDHAVNAIGDLPSLAITKRAARMPAAASDPQSSAAS